MDLIIGTKNKAKIEQIRGALASLKINISGLPEGDLPNVVENGTTALDNAKLKALAYAQAINKSVLSMDNALYLDGLSDEAQPGINVRRIDGRTDRPTDDELLDYYSKMVSTLGDRVKGHWEYGICLAYPDGKIKETTIISPRVFVSQPSKTKVEGYPLESIQIDPESGKYISEMSMAEQEEFWQKTIGRELCGFIISNFLDDKNGYEKIAPTAWSVAYGRAQADIKYAQEIFDELDAVVKPTDPLGIEYLERAKGLKIAPRFEARHKLINRLINENKTGQILEIASGLTPRGLAIAEENPSLCYVEVDLSDMASHKRKLLKVLFDKGRARPQKNLFIEDGDALDYDSLVAATRHFKNEPVVIIQEGLLRYMNFDQKIIVAKNVHRLLEKFGGVWITPDVTLARILEQREEGEVNRSLVESLSGININNNTFESEQAAAEFFESLGFTVEKHSFWEIIDELVSPKKLGVSMEETREFLRHDVVFVMRPKK
ncbi:MAG: non-canonical purine NTP pyrophosphatase [Patescibacteria group bacterium]